VSQPPTAGRRRRLVLAAALSGAAVTAGAVLLITRPWSPTHTAHPAGCPTTAALPAGSPVATSPADGLTVTEIGFNQVRDGGGIKISLGAVVHNTSSRTAYHTSVAFQVTDAAGTPMTAAIQELVLHIHIPIIEPGHSIGVATDVQPELDAAPAARATLTITATTWLPDQKALTQTTGHLVHASSAADDPALAGGYPRYTIDSSCNATYPRGTAVLFRDHTGRLIGGALGQSSSANCDPHGEPQATFLMVLPTGYDPAKTTIDPYCDPQPRAVNGSATFN
jgi:hypothetical protein